MLWEQHQETRFCFHPFHAQIIEFHLLPTFVLSYQGLTKYFWNLTTYSQTISTWRNRFQTNLWSSTEEPSCTLKDILVNSSLKSISPGPSTQQGFFHCKTQSCTTCTHSIPSTTFHAYHSNTTYAILGHANCNSTNVIYIVTCTKCHKQYIGETGRKLKKEFRNKLGVYENTRTHYRCTFQHYWPYHQAFSSIHHWGPS